MKFLFLLAATTCLCPPQVQAAGEVSSSSFYRQDKCGGQVPLDPGKAYHVTTGKGRLGCAKLCAQDEGCLSYTTSGPDCLLYPVRLQTCGPNVSHPRASYYVKRWCLNGGTLLVNTCSCPAHTFGDWCQEVMKDCHDWIKRNSTDGVYWVQPPAAPQSFPVYCQMTDSRGRTYVQNHRRGDPAFSFNRTWEDYKNGFGDPSSKNFWLGLQNLYWLTAGRNTQFNLQCDVVNLQGTTEFSLRTYGHFRIGNESTEFEMLQYWGGSWGPHTDCVTDIIGSKFVTFDRGGSDSLRSCAGELGAGWWMKANGTACSFKCNPNGHLKTRQESLNISDVYFQGLDPNLDVAVVYMFID